MRHGFTVERLQKLSRKIANDELRLRGATLGDRFEDLVSRLQLVGLQAALRFDPERHHASYGKNGGEPFASYVADIMGKRVDDYFRSKSEGFGDRRYGLDDRVELSDELDDTWKIITAALFDAIEDHVTARALKHWMQAKDIADSDKDLGEWVVYIVNAQASRIVGRPSVERRVRPDVGLETYWPGFEVA